MLLHFCVVAAFPGATGRSFHVERNKHLVATSNPNVPYNIQTYIRVTTIDHTICTNPTTKLSSRGYIIEPRTRAVVVITIYLSWPLQLFPSVMSSITYSSTRGGQKNLDFRTVVMTGLAHDRGLFIPDSLPDVTKEELESWRSLSYPDLAVNVISKFVKEDQVPGEKLEDIVKRSCAAFRHEDVTPVIKIGGHAVLVSFFAGRGRVQVFK